MAALASWLDARAHGGRWRVRIEDVDAPRCSDAAAHEILRQLAALDLRADGDIVWQSRRSARYRAALETLQARKLVYPCACTRADIALALAQLGQTRQRHEAWVYPGTCRSGLDGRVGRAWRVNCAAVNADPCVHWLDRRLGAQVQDVAAEVGDFIILRADGHWAYQLAVVVDDADQGVSDVVRGEDLADNTARQILLQQALGLPRPRYLHTPLVLNAVGEKLSKQQGATPIDLSDPSGTLRAAAAVLGLPIVARGNPAELLATWVAAWRASHG